MYFLRNYRRKGNIFSQFLITAPLTLSVPFVFEQYVRHIPKSAIPILPHLFWQDTNTNRHTWNSD